MAITITGSMIGFIIALAGSIFFSYQGGIEKEESFGIGFAITVCIIVSLYFLSDALGSNGFGPTDPARDIGGLLFFGALFGQISMMLLSRWWFVKKRADEKRFYFAHRRY